MWERGWRELDAAAIAALYAEGAFWQQHPFREPEPGYLARVFAEEESARCRFGPPIVDGDQAAVPWSAQTRLTDGGTEDLAGCPCCALGPTGLSWKNATSGPRADARPPAAGSCYRRTPTLRQDSACGMYQRLCAVLYSVKGTARNEHRRQLREEGIMHPTFVKLYIETDADDLQAEEEAKRRRGRRSQRHRSAIVVRAASRDRNLRPRR